jgi:hypothetical protein
MSRAIVDPNAAVLAARGRTHRAVHDDSVEAKALAAVDRPRSFGALLGWYHREWDAEFPARLHERGVEPDSQLGAPRLAGAMRARFAALDEPRAATATDYDREHDTWATGSAPRFPVLDALTRYARKAPLLSAYLTAVAYRGFDWRAVATERLRVWDPVACRFSADDEHHYLLTFGALSALWEVWSMGQREAGRDA